ncbi:MAG: hypothetical protein CSA09_02180 [Candidatus Contendobacter odensis]|uniref:Uncharacterized protein n=1 Tax=Candidatus Contendibacter odensensis TaxID=1400860 RepID=A0A2G6PFG1_9GAMM|nr:MAG: hypothetical protein CSA09_02180 [Candidatus Contendobacter odensis]
MLKRSKCACEAETLQLAPVTCCGVAAGNKGLNTSRPLVMYGHGLSIRALIMAGPIAEGTPAPGLIGGFHAKQRLANKGYDRSHNGNASLKPAGLAGYGAGHTLKET